MNFNKKILVSVFLYYFFIQISVAKSASYKQIPKMVKIDNALGIYASVYEITNIEYRYFLSSIRKRDTALYSKCLYDSTQWCKKFMYLSYGPVSSNYHSHPAYDNYPVVNISLEAAKSYCDWLTEEYNHLEKREFKEVKFVLPLEPTWISIASPLPDHNLPWYGDKPYENGFAINANGSFNSKYALANVKARFYPEGPGAPGYYGRMGSSTKVGSYKPNSLGIFDIIGNVAEMTRDGVIKGGSWDNFINECTIYTSQNYSLPDPRVGFRVVMIVVTE